MKFENGLTRNFKINTRHLKFTLRAYFTYLTTTHDNKITPKQINQKTVEAN